MKKHFLSLFVIAVVLGSCNDDNVVGEKIIKVNGYEIKEYNIDSCQYIGNVQGDSRSNYLTHKGNCNNPIHFKKAE